MDSNEQASKDLHLPIADSAWAFSTSAGQALGLHTSRGLKDAAVTEVTMG